MVDRISELPDDILVSIISLLPFREAKAAKLLSARWRRLNPTGKVVSFKFPAATHRREGYEYVQVADEAKFFDYINWVNRGGLDSYKAAASAGGGAVKLLRIDIPSFDDEAETKLVEFATSMEAEIIDIRTIYSPGIPLTYPYVRNITAGVLIDSPLKCLKELSLSGVALHSHDMGALLWKAVGLERLAIESPRLIPAGEFCMHVDGDPACRLKHLQISNVLRNELTICVQGLMRLVSLKFDGLGAFTLDLQNLPELVHLRARTAAPSAVVGISCLDCARLLRRLELSVGLFNCGLKKAKLIMKNDDMHVCQHPCLKHLELNVFMGKECSVHQLFLFIQTFPYLEKLEIKFIRSFEHEYNKQRKLDEDCDNKTISRIFYLKTVRLLGFSGRVFELEFASCVLHNAVDLQELIVEGCVTNCAIQQRQIARSFQYLLSVTPSFVDLILK